MKLCGVPASLYFLPIIALTGYSIIAFIPTLAFIRWAKVVENSADYSLQNTARQALFLPTTREEKYKAKAAIDTFFVRIGDLLSTGLVLLSVQFSLALQTLSVVNVSLTALWLLLVVGIGASYRALAAQQIKAAFTERFRRPFTLTTVYSCGARSDTGANNRHSLAFAPLGNCRGASSFGPGIERFDHVSDK